MCQTMRFCDMILHKRVLDRPMQECIVKLVRDIAGAVPFITHETRRGQKLSVRMTSAGDVGWISDRKGYRYEASHLNGKDWPEIPTEIRAIWDKVAGVDEPPDSCLINYYGEGARMGLHQDRDEADLSWPVVSVSLGDAALFRVGGENRRDPTRSIWLESGDVIVMSGASRLRYHGIDRIRFRSADLLPNGGRINLTMRVAQ